MNHDIKIYLFEWNLLLDLYEITIYKKEAKIKSTLTL